MPLNQHEPQHLPLTDSNRFAYSFLPGLLFVALMWLVHVLAYFSHVNLAWLGVLPRNFFGLVGVFLSPLIHSDLKHLLSNTFPLVLLSGLILFLYRWQGVRVLVLVYVLSGILTWFIGREAYHIGASGVVYGMAGFLLFKGFFSRDRGALAIAFAVLFMYSGLFYGLFPEEERVSWEGHLAGMVAGLIGALTVGRQRKPVVSLDSSEVVQTSVTQRHVSSTFIPYYLHYSLHFTLQDPNAPHQKYNYSLTPDTLPPPSQTKHSYTASLKPVKTTKQYGNETNTTGA